MAENLRKLILEQANATNDMKRILINYKKLAKANITLGKTNSHLAELQALWKEVRYRHNDITFVATEEDRKKLPYFTQDEYQAAEDAYNQALDHLQEAIDALVTPSSSASPSSPDPVDDETQSSSTTLQRIPIPTFTGEFTEWPRFRHFFHSLVHSNKALTKIAKFHYVISSVAGPAATSLDGLNVSPENYDDAWRTLLEEYDNEKELVRAHLRTIIYLPDGKLETAAELKKLKDTVRVALINVANLGFQVDNWDPLLVTIMSEKFGTETDAKWREHLSTSKKSPSYKELSDFLNGCILSLPASKSVTSATVNNSQKKGRSTVHNVSV
jgi:tetratricopeptide (TPR) repeat protein